MVVIADDLTGAADCVARSAALNCSAAVLLYSPDDRQSKPWPDVEILSIDANSRCLPAEKASELTGRLVDLWDSHSTESSEHILFKKVDSTLRGHVAVEVAALLRACRTSNPRGAKLSILMAPALPAQGRTTVGGRLLVHGVPLEKTDIWQTEARTAESDIPQLLASAGLSCGLVDIETVRSGSTRLRQAILESAKQVDVVVCDAEKDTDLRAIAEASVGETAIAAFVGSAGLASQIPRAIGITPDTELREWRFAAGPMLLVVGTAASVSRQQARLLEAIPGIAIFHAAPATLLNSDIIYTEIMQSLQSGHDVLLQLKEGEHCSNYDGQSLTQALSELVSKCAPFLGGLVATGGETARAVLEALGIRQLRLLGEVEAGLPFSVAEGWVRPLPVITKAGAFGSPQALIRCRDYLRKLERVPASARRGTDAGSRESI
jgi:D-threonate/D-erythronate kinase